jgi:hypothetical protein
MGPVLNLEHLEPRQKKVHIKYLNFWYELLHYGTKSNVYICVYQRHIDQEFFLVSLGGVRLSPLGTSATVDLLYQPGMIDDDDCAAVGRMRTGRGNRSTRRKPAPMPLCPPQIPHDLTWDRTRAAAVGSQRLTAWAMARPDLRVNERGACLTRAHY